jgi:hypothetical protein
MVKECISRVVVVPTAAPSPVCFDGGLCQPIFWHRTNQKMPIRRIPRFMMAWSMTITITMRICRKLPIGGIKRQFLANFCRSIALFLGCWHIYEWHRSIATHHCRKFTIPLLDRLFFQQFSVQALSEQLLSFGGALRPVNFSFCFS